MTKLKTLAARLSKALGALLGGATAAGVATVAHAFGVELTPELASVGALALATLGAYLAPSNKTD